MSVVPNLNNMLIILTYSLILLVCLYSLKCIYQIILSNLNPKYSIFKDTDLCSQTC